MIKSILSVFIITLLTSGCMQGLRWATDSELQDAYKREAYEYWSKKETKYLIRHFKAKAAPKSDSFFFARPVKDRIDFKVILSILSNRLEDEGVLECLVETAKNPHTDSNAGYIIPVIALYYDKGIDVSSYFIDLYKTPEAYESLLKYYIVKVLNEKKIRIPELAPYIKEELERKKTSVSSKGAINLRSIYDDSIEYLKFMGETID